MTQLLSLPDIQALACDCLTRAGVPDEVARDVAAEIAAAEAAGERHHGMEALLRDIRLLRYGRIHADARPTETRPRPGLIRIDAGHGFAAAALSGAVASLAELAEAHGIAMARLDRASAPGAMIRALQHLAARGLTGIAFGTTGSGRVAHPALGAPIPIGRIEAGALMPPGIAPHGTPPTDSPLGGPVCHGAWLVALVEDAVDTALLHSGVRDTAVPPSPPHEIALSVELLEQIVTA